MNFFFSITALAAVLSFANAGIPVEAKGEKSQQQHLRRLQAAPSASVAAHTPGSSIRVEVANINGAAGFDGIQAEDANGGYILLYRLEPGVNVQVKSSPKSGDIEIRILGNPNFVLSAGHKEILAAIADALESDDSFDTYSEVDTVETQGARAARLLSDWPDTLSLNFDYDPTKEPEREPLQPVDTTGFPFPPEEHGRDRVLETTSHIEVPQPGHEGHHYRRLAYTSLCSYVNQYYQVTHDDWSYNRGDDRTTFYAYLSMHSAGPCSDGTYFWTGSSWTCYEPDHDPNIEYAFGDCFGRCGGGCGSNTQFTRDCADHDSCVRFGHSLASFWCDDEFSTTVDDALFAPNCL